MAKISVIIPAYNAEETIYECVRSVLDNDYDNFEIIVVDDKSTDDTAKILNRTKDDRVKLFVNKTNSGAPFSRNQGIKQSNGEIVLLLDSDSFVEKNWIRDHADIHKKKPVDILGGGVIGIHKSVYGMSDNFCSWWTSIPHSKDYYLKKLHLPTNNLSIKKSLFLKIGYFNEEFCTGGGEDAEFCFRALKNNLKIFFKSDLTVYHYDRDDLKGFLRHQASWGKHAVKMRKGMNMDYSYLLPRSYFFAYLYIVPLAILYTVFTIKKWLRYRPSVLLCLPFIFLGKLQQTIAIKDSLKRNPPMV